MSPSPSLNHYDLSNYKEWKHSIARVCRIPLTLAYVKARIVALQDDTKQTTRRFIETWGDAHSVRVVGRFRLAHAEIKGNPA